MNKRSYNDCPLALTIKGAVEWVKKLINPQNSPAISVGQNIITNKLEEKRLIKSAVYRLNKYGYNWRG